MIKIFNATQTQNIDRETVLEQNISSSDLMERASLAIFNSLNKIFEDRCEIIIFAGAGNNGGDALAVARMLLTKHHLLEVYLVDPNNNLSPDCLLNYEHLKRLTTINTIQSIEDIPAIASGKIIIDGLFGSGLNRPLGTLHRKVVEAINESGCEVYSIDIPSGMYIDNNSDTDPKQIVRATEVFTFQSPKLSLLLPESNEFCQKMSILDIGLDKKTIEKEQTNYYFTEKEDIVPLLPPQARFTHKGDKGKAYIIAGSFGKMGAAILSARACMRTGIGLLTVHTPLCGTDILQNSVPEAMVNPDKFQEYVSGTDLDLEKHAVGIGPGIGMHFETKEFLFKLFKWHRKKPMVIDADAINLIASYKQLTSSIPLQSILTPHPLEFDRLSDILHCNGYSRLQSARKFACEHKVYIVLKGAYTAVITPENKVYFNSTGNPGMATAGSGDVLTGIITSLLAQTQNPLHAALLGVYLHGLAGDLAAKVKSERSMTASDIIDFLGAAYKKLEK